MQSIYEEEILELVASAWDGMTRDQKVHWEGMKIAPEKWVQKQFLPMEYSKEPISIDRDEFDDVDMEGGAFDDGNDEGLDEYSEDVSSSRFEEGEDQEIDEGFWVIAVIGNKVLWYNHLEQGFNISHFSSFGCIDKYDSRKDSFDTAFKRIMPV